MEIVETQNLAKMFNKSTLALINNSAAFRAAIEQLAICFTEHAKELQPGGGDSSLDISNLVQPQEQKLLLNSEQNAALAKISEAIQSNKLDSIKKETFDTLVTILSSIDSGIERSDRGVMMTKTLGEGPMRQNYFAAMAKIDGSDTFAIRLVSSISNIGDQSIWQRFIDAIKERTQSS